MESITRDIISPSIKFYEKSNTPGTVVAKTKEDFDNNIILWKIILYEEYNLRPGNTVVIFDSTIKFDNYCCLLFAAAELGLKIILAPEHSKETNGKSEKMDAVVEKFGLIDLCLVDTVSYRIPIVVNEINLYCKAHTNVNTFYTYKVKDPACYELMKNTIFAHPEDILLIATTSGTTGDPKVLQYTHQQMYRLAQRNGQIYGYAGHRICHTRNMHHAFIFMCHFLPVFFSTEQHYSYAVANFEERPNELEPFVNYLIANKISKLVLPYRVLVDSILDHMIDKNMQFDHDIEFITGGFYLTKEYVHKIQKANVKGMYSTFGSNETVSPVLLRYIDQTTDTTAYQNNYLGRTCDNFYQLTLTGQTLKVKCPALFGDETITMADDLSGDSDTGYYHLGRSNFYRINEVEFKIFEVTNAINKIFNGKYDVIIDLEYQKLYMAVWEGTVDIESINSALSHSVGVPISDLANLDEKEYNTQFKLNTSEMREFFRTRNQTK